MRKILLGLIALLLILWLALQTSFVQNWIIGQITRKLSKDLHTTVSIKKVDFDLFNQFLVEGLLIKDLKLDTLAYAGTVSIKVNNWFFFQDKINIKQLEVEKSFVHLWRKDSVWNSQFLLDYFGKDTSTQPSNLKFDLGKVYLTQCRFLIEDQWKGQDQDIRLGRVQLLTDSFLTDRKKNSVERAEHQQTLLFTFQLPGFPARLINSCHHPLQRQALQRTLAMESHPLGHWY